MTIDLDMITGITERERKRIFKWVSTLPDEMVIEIFQDAVKKGYQLKNELVELPGRVAKYCAFILSVREAGWDTINGKGYRVASDPQFRDLSRLRENKAADIVKKSQKAAGRGRTPVLRNKVMAYWGEVKQLKKEGIGFRQIVKYLSKNRKVTISSSHLARIWEEVED